MRTQPPKTSRTRTLRVALVAAVAAACAACGGLPQAPKVDLVDTVNYHPPRSSGHRTTAPDQWVAVPGGQLPTGF